MQQALDIAFRNNRQVQAARLTVDRSQIGIREYPPYSSPTRHCQSTGARSSKERVNQEISENQFTTTRNQIRFEVEQAYSSLGSSHTNISTATQALKC